jgi:hypothetical protein
MNYANLCLPENNDIMAIYGVFGKGVLLGEDNLIGPTCLESMAETIDRAKKANEANRQTVLNIGDSSTSGWNSNLVFKGCKAPRAAFFSYPTYSVFMAGLLPDLNVINAGVPGYSSLQERRYLEYLLRIFAANHVHIDYVTIYSGNNDSLYNGGEDKVFLDGKLPSNSEGLRVTAEDFGKNIEYTIETCRECGIIPFLIMPPFRLDWLPGLRSEKYLGELEQYFESNQGTKEALDLRKAQELYKKGKFRQAYETDIMLPRIKKAYRQKLRKISKNTGTPLIDVQHLIPFDSRAYFIDFCHPIQKTNQLIAEEFNRLRIKIELMLSRREKLKYVQSYFARIFGGEGDNQEKHGEPPNIYPTY